MTKKITVQENLSEEKIGLSNFPVNRDAGWIMANNSVNTSSTFLDDLKTEVSSELGIDEMLKKVGGDSGLLSPSVFGHLGGGMSSRLTQYGKKLYNDSKKGGKLN